MARKPTTKEPEPKSKPAAPAEKPKREPTRKRRAPGKTKGKAAAPAKAKAPAKPKPKAKPKAKRKRSKPKPKPVGRPSKIDQPVRVMVPHPTTGKPVAQILTVGDAFVKVLETGCSIETAAGAVGVSKRTVYDWLAQAEEHADSEAPPAGVEKFLHFSHAVTRAREQVVEFALGGILEAGKSDWRAYAWYLERSRPQEYGRSHKIDLGVQGTDGHRTSIAELMASAVNDPSSASDDADPDLG